MNKPRPPAVAGAFYPGDPQSLAAMVDRLLAKAESESSVHAKALILPHAGYVYSGSTAALGYAELGAMGQVRSTGSFCSARRTGWPSMVLPCPKLKPSPRRLESSGSMPRPLPELPTCRKSSSAIRVHAFEHSLEVHLPFLQRVLGDFTLVPLAVGRTTPDDVSEVLDRLWGGPETLIVVSSDLSHFLPYATAQQVDSNTCRHILQLDTHIHPEQACGAYPVNGLLLAASRRGLKPTLLGLCNSGDTAGDRDRVVGYAAFAFTEGDDHG